MRRNIPTLYCICLILLCNCKRENHTATVINKIENKDFQFSGTLSDHARAHSGERTGGKNSKEVTIR